MRELLMAAAERGIRYLESLNGRGVAPDPAVLPVSQSLLSRYLLIRPLQTKPWLCSIPITLPRWRWPGRASLVS